MPILYMAGDVGAYLRTILSKLATIIICGSLFLMGCTKGFRSQMNGGSASSSSTTVTGTSGILSAQAAYQRSVYVFVTNQNCVSCHATVQVPLYGSANPTAAYQAAQPYVNFTQLKSSIFYSQSMNNHCGNAQICNTDGTKMLNALQLWLDLSTKSPDLLIPTIAMSATQATINNNAGTYNFNVTLSEPAAANITVPYTLQGPAGMTAPDINFPATGTFTIPAFTTSLQVSLPIQADSVYQPDHLWTLSLGTPSAGMLSSAASVLQLTVTSQSSMPTVSITQQTIQVAETVGTVAVAATLSGVSTQAIQIPLRFSGTAANGTRYVVASPTITILAGQTSGSTNLTINSDSLYHPSETIIATLGTPSTGAVLGANIGESITITDNNPFPVLQWQAAAETVTTGSTQTTLNLLSATASIQAISVPYSINGTNAGTITIPAGSSSSSVTVPLTSATTVVALGTPTNASLGSPNTTTVTVAAAPIPTSVQWSVPSLSVAQSAGTATVNLTLNQAATAAIPVTLSVSGTAQSTGLNARYSLASTTISIPAGALSVAVPITLLPVTTYENTDTVILTISSASGAQIGATKVTTISLTDSTPPPQVSWSVATQTISAATATTSVTASLNYASENPVTVAYVIDPSSTAVSGVNYTLAAGTLTIPALAKSATLNIGIKNAAVYNTTLNLVLDLQSPTGATLGTTTKFTEAITNVTAMPQVNWSTATQTLNAPTGQTSVTATAQLSAASGVATVIPVVLGGTATYPSQVNLAPGTNITIPAGSTSGSTTFSVFPVTSNQTVVLSFGTPITGATAGTSIPTETITVPAPSTTAPPPGNSIAALAPTANAVIVRINKGLSGCGNGSCSPSFNCLGYARDCAAVWNTQAQGNLPYNSNPNSASGTDQIPLMVFGACGDISQGNSNSGSNSAYGIDLTASVASQKSLLIAAGVAMVNAHVGNLVTLSPTLTSQVQQIFTTLVNDPSNSSATTQQLFMVVCTAANSFGVGMRGF